MDLFDRSNPPAQIVTIDQDSLDTGATVDDPANPEGLRATCTVLPTTDDTLTLGLGHRDPALFARSVPGSGVRAEDVIHSWAVTLEPDTTIPEQDRDWQVQVGIPQDAPGAYPVTVLPAAG